MGNTLQIGRWHLPTLNRHVAGKVGAPAAKQSHFLPDTVMTTCAYHGKRPRRALPERHGIRFTSSYYNQAQQHELLCSCGFR
jgi:hypothetical protein